MITRLWDSLSTFLPIGMLDSGLSDLLCLETYEHGTSPSGYSSIVNNGVNPMFGGSGGETQFVNKADKSEIRTLNHFFVFDHRPRYGNICPTVVGSVVESIWVRQYAIAASIAQDRKEYGGCAPITGFFKGLAAPTVKIRFRPDDPEKEFENDSFFEPGFACCTEKKISVDHIGIVGTIKQGCNSELWDRIKKHPAQFLYGVTKIITAIALIALAIVASLYSIIAMQIIAGYIAVKSVQAFAQFIVPLLNQHTSLQQLIDAKEEASLISEFTEHVESPVDQPVAILFSGAPGSGKTTAHNAMMNGKERQFVQLDSDVIMERMPRYRELLAQGSKDAASQLHSASLRLRERIMNCAIKDKKSFTLVGSGSNLNLYKEIISKLRKQNYRIKLVRCEVDLEVAKKRVEQRAAITGRYVPEDAVTTIFNQSQDNLETLKSLVDDFELLHTD